MSELTGPLKELEFLFSVWSRSVVDLFLIFGIIVLLHHPAFTELQLADSPADIILQDTLLNLGINFPLEDGELSRPQGQQSSHLQ